MLKKLFVPGMSLAYLCSVICCSDGIVKASALTYTTAMENQDGTDETEHEIKSDSENTVAEQNSYAGIDHIIKYDSRDYRNIPAVKNQKTEQTCWALTAASVLEASMDPETAIAFSSDHIVEQNAYETDQDDGGDILMLMAYLSGWQGPVAEQEQTPENAADVAVHVQEIELLPKDVDEIKNAVLQCGAVQASLYMSRSMTEDPAYYNEESAAYYCPQEMAVNHDVMVIGWDDTFEAGLFGTDPGMDGAFLCQNTWGTSFGQDGVFYVSYADVNFGKVAAAYTRIDPPDRFEKIYQTDDYGWRDRQGFDDEMCWFANVYQTDQDETLRAVGFYAVGPDTEYEVYLAKEVEGPESFAQRELLASGQFAHAGYHTVDLEAVTLREGSRFAVIVKILTPDCETPVAVEYARDERTRNVVLDDKYGYLSQKGDDNWHHTEEKYQTNVCLKAYTSVM